MQTKIPPRRFRPPANSDPERATPQSITHGCDYHLTEHGFEYYYNYLTYEWSIDGRRVEALAYFDQPGPLEVSVDLTFEELDTPRYADLLNYLQRRYAIIKTREESDSVIGWIWDALRPNALKELRQARSAKRGSAAPHASAGERSDCPHGRNGMWGYGRCWHNPAASSGLG